MDRIRQMDGTRWAPKHRLNVLCLSSGPLGHAYGAGGSASPGRQSAIGSGDQPPHFGSWRGGRSRSGQHHATQNSCVMAAGRDQHEAVPNSLLEGQSPPKVKADPDGIEHAPDSDQNRRPNVYRA